MFEQQPLALAGSANYGMINCLQSKLKLTDDGDLPTERGDDDEDDDEVEDGNITDDIPNNTAAIQANIAKDMGVGRKDRTRRSLSRTRP